MEIDLEPEFQEELITVIADFILKRGWRLKLAKKEPIEQSLFIHSFNELGAIQSYLEKSVHPFSGPDILKLYLASITHDCEKETEEWQEMINLGEKTPHHTHPEYAKKFVDELLDFLKAKQIEVAFDQDDVNDIISAQALHMKASAKSARNVFDEMTREHKSDRWSEIAYLIDLFDDIMSKESVESVIALLNKKEYAMLNERLEFTYHKIGNVRGILTSLLHKACEQTYENHNFISFLYYADGTIYFRKRENSDEKIIANEIKDSLKNVFTEFIQNIEDDNKIVIENPQTKFFRGREFFDMDLIDKYFNTLQRKYRAKIDKVKLKRIIEEKFGSFEKAKEKLNLQKIKNSDLIEVIRQDPKKYSEDFPDFISKFQEIIDMSVSKPQQYMFQLFKEIVYDDEIFSKEKDFQINIQRDFDAFFGDGEYEKLRSKSTTNPQIDFEKYVKPYWNKEIALNNGKTQVDKLDMRRQEKILGEKLGEILKRNIGKCSKLPKDEFVNEVTDLLISDLTYPPAVDVGAIGNYAEVELLKVGTSKKKLFNATKGERLCPVCYSRMPESNLITAAFLSDDRGVAKVFSNHATGGSGFGTSVNICKLCYAELLLRRTVLGRTPSDLVILFPSLNFAKIQASNVMELMRDVQNKLEQFYSYHNPNLNERIKWTDFRILTSKILEEKAEEISAKLNPDKFVNSFKVPVYKNEKERELKKLEDQLIRDYNEADVFNDYFETHFKYFNEIAEAIFERRIEIPKNKEPDLNEIIENAGVNTIHYSLIYETPNFIFMSLPMTFSYSEDEAEVNILLKRLLFATYMYLLTDCAVMVIPGKEVIHIPQTRKIVYVPPSSTLKQVIKEDWISLLDLKKWMVAISAGVKLAREGDYSKRSGIFEVLTQPTVGHILSRITSQKTLSGAPKRADRRLIDMLDKLQKSGVLKNETVVGAKV